jgi:hypothetical protein
MLARHKRTSLFGRIVIDEEKSFVTFSSDSPPTDLGSSGNASKRVQTRPNTSEHVQTRQEYEEPKNQPIFVALVRLG